MKFSFRDIIDALKRRINGPAYQLPDGPSLQRIEQARVIADAVGGVAVVDTQEGKLWAMIANHTCPHCKVHPVAFYEGPAGGMSVNIQCEYCGWWFNVTPMIGIAEVIGEKDDREKKNPPWRPEL